MTTPAETPDHDEATPAFNDDPEPDEIGGDVNQPGNTSEPGDEPAVEPTDPVEPTLTDPDDAAKAEAPKPMGGDDDLMSGRYGPGAGS